MKDFYVTKSHADNVASAGEILQDVVGLNRDKAVVIGLSGDLGSGKTTWTKGLVDNLGGDPELVNSPTFVLMNDYEVGNNIYNLKTAHHLDLYRLDNASELSALKLDKPLSNPDNIIIIEWWDKFKRDVKKLASNNLYILDFETINDYTRTISVSKAK